MFYDVSCYLKNLYVFDCLKWTFNLPNFQDRVIQGYGSRGSVGSYLNESLPNITGYAPTNYWTGLLDESSNNCCTVSEYSKTWAILATGNISSTNWKIDASRSSSTYQNSAPVQQNALLMQCCIKY